MTEAASADRGVFADFVEGFLAPIRTDLADATVSEVLINGAHTIFVERRGRLEPSTSKFSSRAELLSALRAVAQFLGRPFDVMHPILEGRLPDGSRLEAILDPLAANGPCVAIRRHQQDTMNWERLIELDAIDARGLQVLQRCTDQKLNLLVSGGTGSGKTSLLRCIASLIPEAERIVSMEDARELHLSQPHVVSLEARPADEKGRGGVKIGDLFHATLRLRPDRIVIGELRGGEALDLIQAMTSGHGGCLSTLHASTPLDALRRLETMALYRGLAIPLTALRSQIASAVDVIVQVERCHDGRRWVRSISRVLPLDAEGGYRVRPILDRRGGAGRLLTHQEIARGNVHVSTEIALESAHV
jgi:pilus assembly protein CpaF